MSQQRSRRGTCAAVTTLIVALLLPVPLAAQTEAASGANVETEPVSEPSHASRAAIGFDVAVLRPLGFAVFLVGAALFVPAALITAPNGREGVESALEIFVTVPTESVFQRPLGEF